MQVMGTLDVKDIQSIIHQIKIVIDANQHILMELDSAMGDGDLGFELLQQERGLMRQRMATSGRGKFRSVHGADERHRDRRHVGNHQERGKIDCDERQHAAIDHAHRHVEDGACGEQV